jgi:hypothetical protein
MMNEEIVSEECLNAAKKELGSVGANHVERLAKVLCILLEGIVDTLLEEYETDGPESESDEG